MPNLMVWLDRILVPVKLNWCVVGAITRSVKVFCPSDWKPWTSTRGNSVACAIWTTLLAKPTEARSKPADSGLRSTWRRFSP